MVGKVTAGLVKSNGSLVAYHRVYDYVTCGLTAKKPGLAPCPTLVIDYQRRRQQELLFGAIVHAGGLGMEIPQPAQCGLGANPRGRSPPEAEAVCRHFKQIFYCLVSSALAV